MAITPGSFADVSKKISQVIAKSWLEDGEETQKILLGGNSDNIKKLFKHNDIDLDGLMKPIAVNVVIDTDCFSGSIEQIPTPDADKTLTVKIPYPPRPAEVKDDELKQWVSDCSDNVYCDNVYVRFSST